MSTLRSAILTERRIFLCELPQSHRVPRPATSLHQLPLLLSQNGLHAGPPHVGEHTVIITTSTKSKTNRSKARFDIDASHGNALCTQNVLRHSTLDR
ncbi:hypothetical protein ANCDUO_15401 [Ancylostoma duodenale]|uniref:Uncharacterized protein n=1 Tax=Ancylostoma duodenale TaxID=51022 RepID=A0A0C2CDQ6_9BILA|nr:hypothetical protein ANCDUO_15401 [Ancylostoma duodenale]